MSTAVQPAPTESDPRRSRSGLARRNAVRASGLLVAAVVLAFLGWWSMAIGSKPIPLDVVWDAVFSYNEDNNDHVVIRELRLPRTLLGAVVGLALGLAGALMQALTRNPLADPGILGVNAGAAAAVVTAISFLGLGGFSIYVWFAFAGAGIASVVVYALGASGQGGASPIRLALAGAAINAALGAFTSAVILVDAETFDEYRFWVVGSLASRQIDILYAVLPFMFAGVAVALLLGPALNALALGDETGRALGVSIGRTRVLGALGVTLLCGAATAAAGPIGFIGLTVPHIARSITGPDQRWVLSYSMVLAPALLIAADIAGRVVVRPGELEVGIVTAFIGAPVFIALVRRRRIAQL